MKKKFIKKFYKISLNHFQVWIKEDMFLEVKLHKDGTYDLLMTNPKFTAPVLGKKITLSEALKLKSKIKIKHSYIHEFFMAIEEISNSIMKNKLKK